MNQLKNLKVLQKSINLAIRIYPIAEKLPDKEKFGLISQIKRSSVSIASNIAEGAGRNSDKEYCYFLGVAAGSSYELETQLNICLGLKYIVEEDVKVVLGLIVEIQKMLFAFQKTLRSKEKNAKMKLKVAAKMKIQYGRISNLKPQVSSLNPKA